MCWSHVTLSSKYNIGIMEKKMETIILGYMGDCQNYGPFLIP